MAFIVAMLSLPLFLKPGLILVGDWPVWWSITHAMHSDIVPHQKWFWGVVWFEARGGLILGNIYSAAIILPWLLSYVVSVTVAQKILFLLTAEMLALSGYAFARGFGSRFTASLAGLLILGFAGGLINLGMWYESLAVAGALLFCTASFWFVEAGRIRYWAMSCLAMTFVFYCHPLGAIMALSAWSGLLLYALSSPTNRRLPVLVALVAVPIIGLLLAAPQVFTLVEFASHGTDVLAVPAGDAKPFVASQKDILRICALALSMPGLCFLWARRRALFWMLFTMMITGVSLYLRLPAWMPAHLPFRSGLLTYSARFCHVTDTLTFILCLGTLCWANHRKLLVRPLKASANDSGTRPADSAARTVSLQPVLQTLARTMRHPLGHLAIIVFFLLLFGSAIVGTYREVPRDTFGTTDLQNDFEELCQWLRLNVAKDDCRVYFEDALYWDNSGVSPQAKYARLFPLSPALGQVQVVNRFWRGATPFDMYYTSDGGRIPRCPIANLDASQIRYGLRRLNCKYLVSWSSESQRSFGELEFLAHVVSFGQFAVFEVTEFVSCWAWSGGNARRCLDVVKISPVEYHVNTGATTDAVVVVSLAYAHRWKAYSGRTELSVKPALGLVGICLGDSTPETVILRYEIRRSPAITCAFVGVVMYFAVLIWLEMRRRRYRRSLEDRDRAGHAELVEGNEKRETEKRDRSDIGRIGSSSPLSIQTEH